MKRVLIGTTYYDRYRPHVRGLAVSITRKNVMLLGSKRWRVPIRRVRRLGTFRKGVKRERLQTVHRGQTETASA